MRFAAEDTDARPTASSIEHCVPAGRRRCFHREDVRKPRARVELKRCGVINGGGSVHCEGENINSASTRLEKIARDKAP